MARGGARNRSGPAADPNSERSEQRGLTYKLLPREGFTGRVPAWPLGGKASTRERQVWNALWRTPQAAMWNVERHRMLTIGHYCRLLVRCEDIEAPAALHAQLHRFADQLGISPAGMKENGWRLATDELASKRTTEPAPKKAAPKKTNVPQRRLRAVNE